MYFSSELLCNKQIAQSFNNFEKTYQLIVKCLKVLIKDVLMKIGKQSVIYPKNQFHNVINKW